MLTTLLPCSKPARGLACPPLEDRSFSPGGEDVAKSAPNAQDTNAVGRVPSMICLRGQRFRDSHLNAVLNGFRSRRMRATSRIAVVTGLLCLWAATLVVAASARLHREFCPEAKEPSHECLFTSLAKGRCVEPPDTRAWVTVAFFFESQAVQVSQPCELTPDHGLPSSRAPPSFLSAL